MFRSVRKGRLIRLFGLKAELCCSCTLKTADSLIICVQRRSVHTYSNHTLTILYTTIFLVLNLSAGTTEQFAYAIKGSLVGSRYFSTPPFCPSSQHCFYVTNTYLFSWVEGIWVSPKMGKIVFDLVKTKTKVVFIFSFSFKKNI